VNNGRKLAIVQVFDTPEFIKNVVHLKNEKMKKLIYGTLFLALVGIGVSGCKKEITNNTPNAVLKNSIENIPTFQSHEDLVRKIEELNAMSDEDRRIYESNSGYKSLFTHAYEIYDGIKIDSLKSKKQLEKFISENSKFVSLQLNNDNELEYRPLFSDIHYSIIANTNRMFKVANLCYKIFDDGIVSSDIENIGLLTSLNQILAKDVPKNDNYEITIYEKMEINGKSSCHPTHNEASVTNGAQRTKITLIAAQQQYGEMETIPGTPKIKIYGVHAFGRVRPYKRTLGIWYHCQRTISGRVAFTVSWKDGTVLKTSSIDQSFSQIHDWSVTRQFNMVTTPLGEKPKEIKFTVINSWGDTPSTSNVSVNCN